MRELTSPTASVKATTTLARRETPWRPGRGERLRTAGGVKSLETKPEIDLWSFVKCQSPSDWLKPSWLTSALTRTAVMRE